MKTMGLIGGLGWASTIEYYRIINQEVNRRLGGHSSAQILLYSFDFAPLSALQNEGKHRDVAQNFIKAAHTLQKGGAEFLLLCANTAHMLADEFEKDLPAPLIHIADVTAKEILKSKLSKVGLLGTKYTMQMDFYKNRLKRHGIESLIPSAEEMMELTRIIRDELYYLKFLPQSKAKFLQAIDALQKRGAEGVILGCTEIPLLIQQKDHELPLFDTTQIHAMAAVDRALSD